MSQNEDLREALLEIEILRARETKSLHESEALLEILRLATSQTHSQDAIQQALQKTADLIDAQVVGFLQIQDETAHVVTVSDSAFVGVQQTIEPSYFQRPLAVFDASATGQFIGFFGPHADQIKSWLSHPIGSQTDLVRIIFAFYDNQNSFQKSNLAVLKRAADFLEPALKTRELSAQNELLAAVIDGSSSGFAIADATKPETPLVFVNGAFEAMTGYSANEVLGKNCRFLTAEDKDSPERTRLRHAVRDRSAGRFLLRNKRKDGSRFWNDLTLFPVVDAQGTVTQLVATQTDATQRVEADQDRIIAQQRLQDTLTHTKDAFLLLLKDRTIGLANDAMRSMFPADPLNWAVGSGFDENWALYTDGLPQSVQNDAKDFQFPDIEEMSKRKDGDRIDLADGRQILLKVQQAQEGSWVLSATDTTTIRNTERMMRQQTAAVENALDGIGILDEDGRIIYANTALGKLFEFPDGSHALGRKWKSRYQRPADAEKLRAEAGLSAMSDILQLKSDSQRRVIHEITVSDVENLGQILVIRDVSAAIRNRNRLTELNAQIEGSKRREALSALAAGLAHDFNNVLSAISGSSVLIASDDGATDPIKSHANRISRASATAARLVNRMLDLGAAGDEAAVFDLRSILSEVHALAQVNLSADTVFDVDAGPDDLRVRADISDITLVILNLVLNASDALKDRAGRIGIRLEKSKESPAESPAVGRINANTAYAKIKVSDTGHGIDPEVLPKVFENYFSTKGSQGTGLGLAMVAAIVKRLEGAIFVRSTPNKGTEFDVFLPLFDATETDYSSDHSEVDLSGQTILVLDDQIDVAQVTAAYLERCGAEVSVIDDPAMAVDVILEDVDTWTALISDYDMPNLSGGNVVEKIRETSQDFPIFIVTALARRLSDPRINASTVNGVFAKPTNLSELVDRLAQLENNA